LIESERLVRLFAWKVSVPARKPFGGNSSPVGGYFDNNAIISDRQLDGNFGDLYLEFEFATFRVGQIVRNRVKCLHKNKRSMLSMHSTSSNVNDYERASECERSDDFRRRNKRMRLSCAIAIVELHALCK
jgi:hypothetical protein